MRIKLVTQIILLLMLLAEVFLLQAQQINEILDKPVFQKLTGDDGLSQGTVTSIVQDKAGFMWFGTKDGLNRWDGYTMEIFKHQPDNPNSINSNVINKILIDPKGILWILTDKGLTTLDPSNGNFKTPNLPDWDQRTRIFDFTFDHHGKLLLATKSNSLYEVDTSSHTIINYNIKNPLLVNNDIQGLFVDSKNKLWITERVGGILLFDRITGKTVVFEKDPRTSYDINQHYISSIAEDKNGNLWLASSGMGLVFLNTENLTLEFPFLGQSPDYAPFITMLDLKFQNDEILWLGSDSEGLLCYNIQNRTIQQFKEGDSENNILYKTISSLYFDRSGNLWIGTNGKGLNILSSHSKKFFSITKNNLGGINLSFESVRSIYEDNNNVLWVGGYSGLQKIDFEKKTSEKVASKVVYSICQDADDENILWLGTEGEGLWKFDKRNNHPSKLPSFNVLSNEPYNNKMLKGHRVYEIVSFPNNKLLIGTSEGLNIFETKSQIFTYQKINLPDPTYTIESGITTIYPDKQKQLWLGSFSGGLVKMSENLSSAVSYTNNPKKPGLPGNRVNCIYEDSKNRFWIATNMGLCLMNRQDDTFITFDESDGLPNNTVYGILEDQDGNLWLSTNNGLSEFDPETKTFRNFNKSDGLPGNEFNSAAFFQYDKSRLYFGGVDGVVVFNPDNVKTNKVPPMMDFTKLKIITRDTVVIVQLRNINEVKVNPDALLLEIEFSAFNFINPSDCHYAYQFGLETKDWIELGNKRSITLTKPNYGEYFINIKASNSDGVWNEVPKTLKINVLPGFSQTTIFKVIVVLIVLSIMIFIFYLRNAINKSQKKKLQLLIEQRTEELTNTNDELNRANASKDKFFSIIAHDLKNPFNVLMGFTDLLVTDWDEMKNDEKIEIIKILKKTAENTYLLLVNLLEWSQIQRQKIQWKPEIFNLSVVMSDVLLQLSSLTELKNIAISIQVDPNLMVYCDINQFNGIMRNLVGNAIKFTKPGGKIEFNASPGDDNFVVCQVKDYGIGMDEDTLKCIFQDEYLQSAKGTNGEPGTGLGLSLCREFVKQNGGKIWAESTIDQGSSFYFTLPVNPLNRQP